MDTQLSILYVILGVLAFIVGTFFKRRIDKTVNGHNKGKKITIKQWLLIVLFSLTVILFFGFSVRIGCYTGDKNILFSSGLFEIIVNFINKIFVFSNYLPPSFLDLTHFSQCI